MTEQEAVKKALYFVESGILSAKEDIIGFCEDEYKRTTLNALLVCKEALEKQVAKKPDTKRPGYFATFGKCKSCGEFIADYYKYCSQCGQKIDWEESK